MAEEIIADRGEYRDHADYTRQIEHLTPIIQRKLGIALAAARREAIQEAGKAVCFSCAKGEVPFVHPKDPRMGYWHKRGHCLAWTIWTRWSEFVPSPVTEDGR